MTDADLIETGAYVDTAIDQIARLVEAVDGLPAHDPDALVIASVTAMSLILDSIYRSRGYHGVRIALDALGGVEADMLAEARRPDPNNAFDAARN
nr:hypothetical protein [uncultured Lichenicoccus sp.]